MIACSGGEKRGAEDLAHAIYMLNDRKEAEQRVIREQRVVRAQLKENMDAANSQGMRDKITKDIEMVDLAIHKAEVNIANQDTLIFQLEQKLDSIQLKMGISTQVDNP